MTALRRNRKIEDRALYELAEAVERLRNKEAEDAAIDAETFLLLRKKRAELGSDSALAKFLGKSRSYVTYLLEGDRPLTGALRAKLGG